MNNQEMRQILIQQLIPVRPFTTPPAVIILEAQQYEKYILGEKKK